MCARYIPHEVPLELSSGDKIALAAEHGEPCSIKVKVGGYRAMLPLTKAQIAKLQKGGRTIRLTPAHLKYLKKRGLAGRGVFTDIGSAIGSALGSAASAGLSAIPGVGSAVSAVGGPIASNLIQQATTAIGKEIDKSIEKRKYNEQQASKNWAASIAAAKKFVAMSPEEQRKEHERIKKIPFIGNISFESYKAKKEAMAKESPKSPKQMLDEHLKKKGYGVKKKTPRALGSMKKIPIGGQKSRSTVSKLAAQYIQAALKNST